jgi:cell division protein FtsB
MVFMRYGLTQLTFTIIRSLLVKCLLLIGLLSCFAAADAQDYNAISFRIDSLADMGLPKSALQEVDKLDALARKNGNTSQQVRAVIYRMTFQSYLEEDALTSIISRLKAIAACQNVLELLPAKPLSDQPAEQVVKTR